MGYVAEHMDPTNNLSPLFEVQLELRDPDLVFTPPLETTRPDGFSCIIESLIADILSMADLIPRVSGVAGQTYGDDTRNHQDILEMQQEIRDTVAAVLEEAREFAVSFEAYSYLWLDDRESYMAQFLAYGRQLTGEEMDLVAANDSMQPPITAPKMDQFREQVKQKLYTRSCGCD